ncbi:glycosyl transferase family 2 [Mucilaginibacter oryzae]|uniref:Glycosyl transferase family 2 n=1 Tax=Mucilaginibacter oryzae TaxID=468058 RepID=A0A316HB52_9SPHI|nr:glycosyltransferase family 2 protein [Mucilaginibacter oryzae]PWK77726.1 glycosyl transferase family 2 [Mucilaginibacter oryzae]
MIKELAIIIPAYKSLYLKEALDSLAHQSNLNFNLYIGDDASPDNLYEIVKHYEDRLTIFYKRFEHNLGGKDLVAHWERCFDMTQDEKWLWLFSDDDIASPECVSSFYRYINDNRSAELLHFNIEMIDNKSEHLAYCPPFPDVMTAADFFEKRIDYKLSSFVVEYIFTRDVYFREGKLQNFDLAWGADDATWIKFAKVNGIHTINGPLVKWRYSGSNVSSLTSDISIITRKLNATISYINWATAFFEKNNIAVNVSQTKMVRFALGSIDNASVFKLAVRLKLVPVLLKGLGKNYSKNLKIISYSYFRVITARAVKGIKKLLRR